MNFEIFQKDNVEIDDVVFTKPSSARPTGFKGVTITTQKNKDSLRLCLAIPIEMLSDLHLRNGDYLAVGFKENKVFLKQATEGAGFKLTLEKNCKKLRLYTGNVPSEWNIMSKIRGKMKSFSIEKNGITIINF